MGSLRNVTDTDIRQKSDSYTADNGLAFLAEIDAQQRQKELRYQFQQSLNMAAQECARWQGELGLTQG